MESLLLSTRSTRAIRPDSLRYVRSDALLAPRDEDVVFLWKNNIRTLVDLREPRERIEKPCPLEEVREFHYLPMPITGGAMPADSPEALAALFGIMADGRMQRALAVIEGAGSNVLFFDSDGNSAAAVVSALLLLHAGASREDILADYLRPWAEDRAALELHRQGMELFLNRFLAE